jgi:hypothetical protein
VNCRQRRAAGQRRSRNRQRLLACPDCNSAVTVAQIAPRFHRSTVEHDESCPWFAAFKRRTGLGFVGPPGRTIRQPAWNRHTLQQPPPGTPPSTEREDRKEKSVTTSSTQIASAVAALADHIAAAHIITFRQLFEFMDSLGIDTVGDEELMGQHVNQPHVGFDITLRARVSKGLVQIVTTLFYTRPVALEIGDLADFRSGEEPWWVTWTGGRRDTFVIRPEAATGCVEFVHERGGKGVIFPQLADLLDSNFQLNCHGKETMMLDDHHPNAICWNYATREFLSVINIMMKHPCIRMVRTTAQPYYDYGAAVEIFHDMVYDDCIPMPAVEGDVAEGGYATPHWVPTMFVWENREQC